MTISSMRGLCVVIALTVGLTLARDCRAGQVYLALGDSVTFGTDPSTPASLIPSYADQGFVNPFANSLAALNGGIRPTVLNLGIPGELSTSFFTGIIPPGWLTAPDLNLNYASNLTTPQNDLMISSINAIHAAGNSVGTISFLIGANDVDYLLGTPAFQNASAADQQAMIAATIGTIQSNYLTVLGELKTYAPEARLVLPDYYNPFPSSDPNHAFYDSLLAVVNPLVQADAAAFGATFVDVQPLFEGRELELTNIATGDFHPNQSGYEVIAGALTSAVVPEPSSIVMLATGAGCLLLHARRRRGGRQLDSLAGR